MKRNKIIYYVATVLLSLMMLGSAGMYLFKHDEVKDLFVSLDYPGYIVYPLAIAKVLGLIVIWSSKGNALKEWAYAGFFFDFVLAFFAHYMVEDGEQGGAAIALMLLGLSYAFGKKYRKNLIESIK